MSFKNILRLPNCLPAVTLDKILHSSEITCSEAAERNARKIRYRFGCETTVENAQRSENSENQVTSISVKLFPGNFKVLFAYTGNHCTCHGYRMTHVNLFRNEGYHFDEWLDALLKTDFLKGRNKATRLAQARRLNHSFVQRLVGRAEEKTK